MGEDLGWGVELRPIEDMPVCTSERTSAGEMAMGEDAPAACASAVDAVYRAESRRVLATLIRLLGDFDLAEEALHDAFAAALEQWPRDGVPGESAGVAGLGRPLQGHRRACAGGARFDASLASWPSGSTPSADDPRVDDEEASRTTGCG